MIVDFEALAKPFNYDDLEWRVLRTQDYGKLEAMITPYVTARAIQDRLDEVCTPAGWWNEFRDWKQGQLCGITIVTQSREVTKWDGAPDMQVEKLKGGLSDATKRAAVQWGIGRYLYYLGKMKADILSGYQFGAEKGEHKDPKTKDTIKFWWKPNAAAVKAIKAASEGK